MSKFRMFLIVMTVFAIATPLVAQDEEMPPPMVAKNHFVTVNSGQALEFEAAYKGHLEFHANHNDSWYWHTWQVTNGQDFGQYIIRTGNHSWSDFDGRGDFEKQDFTHYLENVSGYVKKISSNMVVAVPSISIWPEDYGQPTMVDVTVFHVNSEYDQAFAHTIKKIHKAIVEKEIPFTYMWSYVASGGEGSGPTWVLVFAFKSWAEYGESFEPAFWKMVEEVYGDYETDLIRKLLGKSIAHQENFMAAFREDLSYNPPQ